MEKQLKDITINYYINKSAISFDKFTMVGDSHRYCVGEYEVSLLYPCTATMGLFEICYDADDVESTIGRYNSLEDAEERIYKILKDVIIKNKLKDFLHN